MGMFSKSSEYAIQAVIYMALHQKEEGNIGIKEISGELDIPGQYLGKILQQLARNKILKSTKGPAGGFSFLIPVEELRLFTVVEIIDGPDLFDMCGIGLKKCSDEEPCPVHHEYKIIKNRIKKLLCEKSLAELAEDIKNGLAIIKLN
jgi:Rrf2 family transcriptional regulator, iron-sulfur cluster assembly transcription factor